MNKYSQSEIVRGVILIITSSVVCKGFEGIRADHVPRDRSVADDRLMVTGKEDLVYGAKLQGVLEFL